MNNENYENTDDRIKNQSNGIKKSIASIVLFVISIFLYCAFIFAITEWAVMNENVALSILVTLIFYPFEIPLIISIIFGILSIKSYNKLKRDGYSISRNRKITNCINIGQFIIILLICFLTIPYIKTNKPNSIIKSNFEKKYSDNYEIVGECYAEALAAKEDAK